MHTARFHSLASRVDGALRTQQFVFRGSKASHDVPEPVNCASAGRGRRDQRGEVARDEAGRARGGERRRMCTDVCAKLAVLDESDNVGHWPQVRNTHFGLYFKRSWVHKRNGTHKVHHDVPADISHLNVKAARKDPHLHEICEGNGVHCKHHGHRAWKNRDHPDRGQYFAPLPYAVWDNYTHGLQLGSERDLRVVSTIRSSLKRQPARTRVVEFLKSILYEDMRLTEDEAVVGDTGGHRKTLDNSYFGLMRRAQIVVTCNPSFWDGDFRLF